MQKDYCPPYLGVAYYPEDWTDAELDRDIARMKALVTARTHASIAGYSSCVPTLVIGYSVKARGIARDLFGSEEGHLLPVQELDSQEQLIGAYDALLSRAQEERSYLIGKLPEYKRGLDEAAYAVMKLEG